MCSKMISVSFYFSSIFFKILIAMTTGCIDYDSFAYSGLIFNDFNHSTCLPSMETTESWVKITTLRVNPDCVADSKMIRLEIAVRGQRDCSEQPLFNVGRRNISCNTVTRCYGYNLTPQLPNTTFCLLKCPKEMNNDNLFEVNLISGTYVIGWHLCGLRVFQSEHFPRLIEVYSDGKNEPLPHFAQEFITNGMFVISVSRGRGMNVLDYDPVSGNHKFAKFDIHGSQDAESALLEYVNVVPNGNIVLMVVYDSANPCNRDCRESLDLVGGMQQRIGLRESYDGAPWKVDASSHGTFWIHIYNMISSSAEAVAIIGYRGTCRPAWVTEVRERYDHTTQKGDFAYAAVSPPTSACVGS